MECIVDCESCVESNFGSLLYILLLQKIYALWFLKVVLFEAWTKYDHSYILLNFPSKMPDLDAYASSYRTFRRF